jgi:hypothetical protein
MPPTSLYAFRPALYSLALQLREISIKTIDSSIVRTLKNLHPHESEMLVSFEIHGFDELQKQLEDASKALEGLDGQITTIQFDPNNQSAVDAAIADMERAIDGKTSQFSGNSLVESIAEQMKEKYREQILERAIEAKGQEMTTELDQEVPDEGLFRQIENTVTDLRQTDYNTFERHIGKLSRLLHAPSLDAVTKELAEGVDLDAWVKAGCATEGSMVGSATLTWPSDQKEELGLVVKLIDSFVGKKDDALNFSHTFYYHGNTLSGNLQNMVAKVIVPFARDYTDYVKNSIGIRDTTFPPQPTKPVPRKAFLVHGHDDAVREAVARFMEQLGFEVIILHEQANEGRTVIEKIEKHGDVGFAVVLLTPDDEGCEKGGSPKPRARQNVFLELGYFIGKLGRNRVCALKRGEVEIPSDFHGVVYEAFDSGNGWKLALARELEAAGFEIDRTRIR